MSKIKGKYIKDTVRKPELGKRAISGTFGTLTTIVAFRLHSLAFWIFILPGLTCLSYCLRFELKHHGYKKRAANSWALVLFTVGLLGSLTYYNWNDVQANVPQEPSSAGGSISVKCKTIVIGPTNSSFCVLLHGIPPTNELVLSSVPQLMFVEVVNLSRNFLMIDSYSLEAEIHPGKWIPVTVINADAGQFFMASLGIDKALHIDFGNQAFDSAITGKNIAPYESVLGWIISDIPKNDFGGPWRICITDSTNRKYVENIEFLSNAQQNNIQHSGLTFDPGTIDLRGFRYVPPYYKQVKILYRHDPLCPNCGEAKSCSDQNPNWDTTGFFAGLLHPVRCRKFRALDFPTEQRPWPS